ncbi:MAG: Rieske 2Fe-2S domain-containing protein, partial [Bacteroidota bacterium]|nr:Rieske 2Fe-2S domain-containing protein [Bacteroidota bacterium]
GEVKDISEIPKNSGAIIREGLNKVAVYVDGDGEAHKYSAFCTHLKCILQWNQVENSWDCPCHGSRYDKSGKVLNGPAISDMKKVE